MKVYNYSPNTGEFTNEADADTDPLASAIHALIVLEKSNAEIAQTLGVSEAAVQEVREEGVQELIPANATSIAPPPSVDRKARVFQNGAWKYVADYRNTEVKANDGSNRAQVIDKLGVKPEDVKFEPMPPSEEAKAQVKTHLAAMMDYLLEPTEEKKQQLIELYQELLSDAA